MKLLITLLIVFVILVLNELYWRNKKRHSELSRKFIHIVVGSFVAFWPFYLSWLDIQVISLAFIVVVLISRKINLFKSIHSVGRTTWGELYFGISVGLVSVMSSNKWVYMVAILQMSLADGLAAVIGSGVLIGRRYKIFGHNKSIIGSLTFYIVSFILTVIYLVLSKGQSQPAAVLIVLPLVSTALENVSVGGLDNLTVPFVYTVLLNIL